MIQKCLEGAEMDKINLIIKPHHLLDIFKLYGKGIERFVPNETYNHNFYLIGNAVIEDKINKVTFTYGCDDICKPCVCLKHGICEDTFLYKEIVYNKNSYNERLDKRLDLDLCKIYEFSYIIYLFHTKVDLELINFVWNSNTCGENESRYEYIEKGLDKYIIKYGLSM